MTSKSRTASGRGSLARLGSSIWLVWRGRRVLRWITLVVVLGGYAVLSLEPFDWRLPRRVSNHAERLAEGWRFAASGVVLAPPPSGLEAARADERIGVALVVRPLRSAQTGPARIFTISRDTRLRNLTIAQEDDDLVLRLRTAESDFNGLVDGDPFARIADVFRHGRWTRIDLEIAPGELTLAIDGEPALTAALPAAVLATWQPSMGVALGNEMTCNRPWLGDIRTAVVTLAGSARDYANDDQGEAPPTCWVIDYRPAVVPFRLFLWEDAVRNVLMYIPLGCLLGLMVRSRSGWAVSACLFAVVGVSATFEIAQGFVASRFPSIDDVICNAVGGAVGLGLAWRYVGRASDAPDVKTTAVPARSERS
jgi:hypothetical protein